MYSKVAEETKLGYFMKDEKIIALFKIGDKCHIEQLINEGLVYMRPLSYFTSRELDQARSDPDEGTVFSIDASGAELHVQEGETYIPVAELTGAVRFRDDRHKSKNLYCLYARTMRDYGVPFNLGELNFGDSFVLFLNADEFLNRLCTGLSKLGLGLRHGPVRYVKKTYTDEMGPFRKYEKFAAQSEYRIVVEPGTGEILQIRVGDLSDIALLGSTKNNLRLDPSLIR